MARALQDVNLLNLAPVRLAQWEQAGERIVLHRPRPQEGGLKGLLRRIAFSLSASRIRLDDIGSFAWQRLDGRATVGEVAEAMRGHFGEEAEPAEERLGHFVRTLRREGMVAFPGWDSAYPSAHDQ